MFNFSRCCDTSNRAPGYSAWIMGLSLGAVLISAGSQLTFGKNLFSQTLLLSAFPLALIVAERLTALDGRPSLMRTLGVLLTLAAVYGFFLAVVFIADAF